MWNQTIVITTLIFSACAVPPEQGIPTANTHFVPGTTVDFTFESNGLTLSGVIDTPAE